MAEAQLDERLFPTEHIPSPVKRPPADCEHIYNELGTYRKFNLTLSQLWLEYKDKHLGGYYYSALPAFTRETGRPADRDDCRGFSQRRACRRSCPVLRQRKVYHL